MKAIMVEYDKDSGAITLDDSTQWENWSSVCEKFNDDVHRVRDVKNQGEYTGLYECFDDVNKKSHYLVEEDARLFRIKRRNFLQAIGKTV